MSGARAIPYVKGDAYGNDFLLIERGALRDPAGAGLASLARTMCDRRAGVGADGLIAWRAMPGGASMELRNADGSPAEVSGNGVRCLAALLVEQRAAAGPITIATAGGDKVLTLLNAAPPRYTFRARMGDPLDLAEETLSVEEETVRVVTLSVGNPQCVVLLPSMTEAERRFGQLGPALAAHGRFPDGTNVELAVVERSDLVRMLIWERGVGPTAASGTGACAAAVAAARYGGAGREVEAVSPGGSQRVAWTDGGIDLTGWAELVMRGEWTT